VPAVVEVHYPDGKVEDVKVNIIVEKVTENNLQSTTQKVAKSNDVKVNNYVAPRAIQVHKEVTRQVARNNRRTLPQTGAKQNLASEVLGMVSLGLGALAAGFEASRRKKNK
ncbi:MAG: LPXTG cell wall anchor domain-containing protein, partial [Lactobacillus sp.]|uniref:LPXTG cell wall anchor domain-containing protein n=1 Tax=Lactobacillus sp. TaxID=1591 RepID=UPI0023CE9864